MNTPAIHSMLPRQSQHAWDKDQEAVTHLVCCRSGSSSPHPSHPRSLACHHRGSPGRCTPAHPDRAQKIGCRGQGVAGVGEEDWGLLLLRPQDLESAVSAGEPIRHQQRRQASTAPLPQNPRHGQVAVFVYLVERKSQDPGSLDHMCGVLAHYLMVLNWRKWFFPFRPINLIVSTTWCYILGMQNKVSFWRRDFSFMVRCLS